VIAKLPSTKAAANVAANRVDKVRMMAPGEWHMADETFGFRIDATKYRWPGA